MLDKVHLTSTETRTLKNQVSKGSVACLPCGLLLQRVLAEVVAFSFLDFLQPERSIDW